MALHGPYCITPAAAVAAGSSSCSSWQQQQQERRQQQQQQQQQQHPQQQQCRDAAIVEAAECNHYLLVHRGYYCITPGGSHAAAAVTACEWHAMPGLGEANGKKVEVGEGVRMLQA